MHSKVCTTANKLRGVRKCCATNDGLISKCLTRYCEKPSKDKRAPVCKLRSPFPHCISGLHPIHHVTVCLIIFFSISTMCVYRLQQLESMLFASSCVWHQSQDAEFMACLAGSWSYDGSPKSVHFHVQLYMLQKLCFSSEKSREPIILLSSGDFFYKRTVIETNTECSRLCVQLVLSYLVLSKFQLLVLCT